MNPSVIVKSVKKRSLPPEICKAARALLRISQDEMAEHVGLSSSTIRRLEAGLDLNEENSAKLIEFLRANHIVLIHRGEQIVGLLHGEVADVVFENAHE